MTGIFLPPLAYIAIMLVFSNAAELLFGEWAGSAALGTVLSAAAAIAVFYPVYKKEKGQAAETKPVLILLCFLAGGAFNLCFSKAMEISGV